MSYFKTTAAVIVLASLAGCVTNRSEVDVTGPVPQVAASGQGQQIYINAWDERLF